MQFPDVPQGTLAELTFFNKLKIFPVFHAGKIFLKKFNIAS